MFVHFNEALDELRGQETEQKLAQTLGISHDVLTKYRKGAFPKNVGRLLEFPGLLEALAQDARAAATPQDDAVLARGD